ncbi:MAG: DUF4129 domain-containing protein [Candidatus Acetothermia bacterium]|jgi:hypothetical protein|nr:DUF4129 domain-containing protein [Candidatus Acetothermia bacterium]MDH7505131.1 DUF4129 domain-containing protein [Candidatus Acetothermia bacterium]
MLHWARERKLVILVLAAALAAAVLILAPSLSQVRFEAGRRLFPGQGDLPPGAKGTGLNLDLFWQVAMWTLVILFPFSIIAAFIWPENFKYALIRSVVLVLFLGMLFFSIRALKDFLEQLLNALDNLRAGGLGAGDAPGLGETPLNSVRAPRWSIFPFLLAGLGLLALAGWRLRRFWRRGRADRPLLEVAAAARRAAEEVAGGGDLRNAILRCYREMSRLLSEQRHVPFPRAMTAREFEERLRAVGVQDEHVGQLSRLFELVRYGGRASGPREEAEALDCLRAIERAYSLREAAG